MKHPSQPIIQHLFQASSLEDVPRQQLESFVEEYPCFGFARYLLSHKLRTENDDQFTKQTQKTSLYFSNPFWLQWLLENMPVATDGPGQPLAVEQPVTFEEASTLEWESREQVPISAEEEVAFGVPFLAEDPTPPPSVEAPHATEESIIAEQSIPTEEFIPAEQSNPAEQSVPAEEPGTIGAHLEADTPVPVAEEPGVETNQPSEEPGYSAAELLLTSIEEAKGLRESLQRINEDFHDAPTEEPIQDIEPPFILEEGSIPDNGISPVDGVQETDSSITDSPAFNPAPVEITITQSTAAVPEITFEPYHTIDYFASQGIRLTLEENPSDSLGRQLKSFTDWLKVMRRLPQKEREFVPDRAAEQTIQTFAAHSVEGKEVVTETMAEVLAKQGMTERARLVYEKLSLLNPEKRAYFAAKIEHLNIH